MNYTTLLCVCVQTGLSHACGCGFMPILQLLDNVEDVDPNLADNDGNTPLIFAAQAGMCERRQKCDKHYFEWLQYNSLKISCHLRTLTRTHVQLIISKKIAQLSQRKCASLALYLQELNWRRRTVASSPDFLQTVQNLLAHCPENVWKLAFPDETMFEKVKSELRFVVL